jgi:hypothetical protein
VLNEAIRQTFAWKTRFLEGLRNPFSGYSGTKRQDDPSSKSFKKAIVFPIPSKDGAIMHGAVVIAV